MSSPFGVGPVLFTGLRAEIPHAALSPAPRTHPPGAQNRRCQKPAYLSLQRRAPAIQHRKQTATGDTQTHPRRRNAARKRRPDQDPPTTAPARLCSADHPLPHRCTRPGHGLPPLAGPKKMGIRRTAATLRKRAAHPRRRVLPAAWDPFTALCQTLTHPQLQNHIRQDGGGPPIRKGSLGYLRTCCRMRSTG